MNCVCACRRLLPGSLPARIHPKAGSSFPGLVRAVSANPCSVQHIASGCSIPPRWPLCGFAASLAKRLPHWRPISVTSSTAVNARSKTAGLERPDFLPFVGSAGFTGHTALQRVRPFVETMEFSSAASGQGNASLFAGIEMAPPDPVLGLQTAYKACTAKDKVDLGVGAYRTEEGKPYVFECVRQVEAQLAADTSLTKEYLPIDGLQELKRVVYMSNPTWANHPNIFKKAGFEVATYPYWDPATRQVNFDGMLKTLEEAAPRSVLLLHACAHNPTGVDLSQYQWRQLLKTCKGRGLIPILDTAYQGFASGDLKRDRFSVELFCNEGNLEMFVCQSFAKNMGLYGERAGMLHIVCASKERAEVVLSQLKKVIRPMYSNPPLHPGRIACKLLTDPQLRPRWEAELKQVSERIQDVRRALRSALEEKGTPGTWKHITDQIGMFSYTGLTPDQCDRLTNRWHIFLMQNGRISLAGLNKSNVDYVANAINDVVRTLPASPSRI